MKLEDPRRFVANKTARLNASPEKDVEMSTR